MDGSQNISAVERLIGTAVRHHVLANVAMGLILLAGAVAAMSMLREAFPEIRANAFTVTVVYPGADVEEVEEGVSRKIEEAIDGLEGIKRYSTFSRESVGTATIEVFDRYPMETARDLIENAIESISTFPVSAEKPIVSEIMRRDEVLVLTLWGDLDERTRKEMAEQIKDELQEHPAISQVDISGVREYEIFIELSEQRLREYGLTFESVTNAIRRGSVNLSGGSLRTKSEEINIRAEGRKYTGEEIGRIVVITEADGTIITLDQVATIRDGFTEDPIVARFNGQPAVILKLLKTSSEDTIAIAEAGHQYAVDKEQTLPEGVFLTAWADGALVIQDRLAITFRNGLIGLSLVIAMLWMFLDTRLSFWVAMGIPISLAGSLVIMWIAGLTLNSVTLFGLVMVTGIVVDDAIVVGEAIFLSRSKGAGPLRAVTNGLSEVGLPVIAAVCTTIVAFLPMGFVSGVMGQFMGTMAIAVIGALAVSLIEALFILPSHLTHLPAPDAPRPRARFHTRLGRGVRKTINSALDFVIQKLYRKTIRVALQFRYVTVSIAVAIILVTLGLGGAGFIKFTPFPNWDDNQIVANIEFPRGTPATVTESALVATEQGLFDYVASIEEEHGKGLVEEVFSLVGSSGGGGSDDGAHTGMVRVQLRHSNFRDIHSQDILAGWQRQVGDLTGALSQSYTTGSQGPGGKPIELWLQGRDREALQHASQQLKDQLRTYEGVYDVQDSFRPGKRELKVDVKPEAQGLGITLDDLAGQVYAGFFGQEAVRIQRGRDDVRVKVRYTNDERATLGTLDSVRIRTAQGYEVPLYSVADVEFGHNPAIIERSDGQRRIAVSAEVDEKRTNAQEVLGDLQTGFLDELIAGHPGVSLSLEGAQQDAGESLNSLITMFPLAMIGIFVIIATIFRSYFQPFVIMLTVPFGIIGAALGHAALGWQMSMFSVFGMFALTGVVVNDAIVFIEAVNGQIARGLPVFDAIEQGGVRRFRAILLTTVSTIGALVPMIIETDLSAQPLNPMALSVASGVGFATVLTLVYVPCLLAILNDFRRLVFLVVHERWPTREEVEPASLRHVEPFAEESIESSGELSTS